MAFPTTPVLDTFTRANESALASPWAASSHWWVAPLTLVSNAVANSDLTGPDYYSGSYWTTATYGPDLEAYFTLAVLPADTGAQVVLDLAVSGLSGAGPGTMFDLTCERVGSGNFHVTLILYVADVASATIFDFTTFLQAGDQIGISRIGTTWAFYVNGSPFWQGLSSAHLVPLTIGLGILHLSGVQTARIDNVGGGTYVPTVANITPATATNIASLPFTVTQDVAGAPVGSALYPVDCAGDTNEPQQMAVWYKYTPPPGVTAIGIALDSTNRFAPYDPRLSIWVGTPPALVPYGDTANPACFSNNFTISAGTQQFSVTPGTTYYLLIVHDNRDVLVPGASLVLSVYQPPSGIPVPPGTFIVSNDTPGGPTGFIAADGTLTGVIGFPSFEYAEWLPSGILGVMAEGATAFELASLNIYDRDFHLLHTVTSIVLPTSSSLSPICSDRVDTFYCIVVSGSTSPVQSVLYKVSTSGTVLASWNMGSVSWARVGAVCVNLDETIAYFQYRPAASGTDRIGRWDLAGNVQMSDLVVPSPTIGAGRDLIYLSTDEILWEVEDTVRRYNTAGTLLSTYTGFASPGAPSSNRLSRALDDPLSFWVMWWPAGSQSGDLARFSNVRISDGVVVQVVDTPIKRWGSDGGGPAFGVSQSCPLLVMPAGAPLPPVSGCVPVPPAAARTGSTGDLLTLRRVS